MSEAGTCLCGACRFSATLEGTDAGVCHCGMCRKWSGGIMFSTPCSELSFEEGAPLGIYNSSEWGERLFCKECGSVLAWRSKDHSMKMLSIQTLDHPEKFNVVMQMFVDEKPANYALAQETATMTGAEVFAAFAPNPEGH